MKAPNLPDPKSLSGIMVYSNLFLFIGIVTILTLVMMPLKCINISLISGTYAPRPELKTVSLGIAKEGLAGYLKFQEENSFAERDINSQSILIIGDGVAGHLLDVLNDYAEFNGHTISASYAHGSTTLTWSATDSLAGIIATKKPSLIIVALGSNEVQTKSLEELHANTEKIFKMVQDVKFVWIGPPNWQDDNGFDAVLSEALGKGRYFSTKELKLPIRADGEGGNEEAYSHLAEKFAHWLMNESKASIVFEVPIKNQGVSVAKSHGH